MSTPTGETAEQGEPSSEPAESWAKPSGGGTWKTLTKARRGEFVEAFRELERKNPTNKDEEFRKIWDELKVSVKKAIAEENDSIRGRLSAQELEAIGLAMNHANARDFAP